MSVTNAEEEFQRYKNAVDSGNHSEYLLLGKYPHLTALLDRWAGGRVSYLPRDEEISDTIKRFEKEKESLERFKLGDQFTIAVPKNYSSEKITNLCKEINSFMVEKEIVDHGGKSDVALPITNQINVRLEYFPESIGDRERINGSRNSNEPDSRRLLAVQELKKNTLYQSLEKVTYLTYSTNDNFEALKQLFIHIENEVNRFEKNSKSIFGIGNKKKSEQIQKALKRAVNHFNQLEEIPSGNELLDYRDENNISIRQALSAHRIGFFGRPNSLRNIEEILIPEKLSLG